MIDASQFTRRQLAVGAVAVVAVVIAGVMFWNRGDDDEKTAARSSAPASESTQSVVERFQKNPCSLLSATEVREATEREAEVRSGGPSVMCTYALAGTPAGDAVTAQVSGPVSEAAFARLMETATALEGDIAAYWQPGGGTGGRVLAQRGDVLVEVGVRLAETDETLLQQVGRRTIDAVLARIPANVPAHEKADGATDDADCSLVSTDAVADVLGGSIVLLPAMSDTACTFRGTTSFASIERLEGPAPDLSSIGRSVTTADGETTTWQVSQVDVGDEAVFLADPDSDREAGEIYALQGDTVIHVVLSNVPDTKTKATQLAGEVLQ